MISKYRINEIIKPVLWDYDIDPYEFYLLAIGKNERIGMFDVDRSLLRLLERLSWYDLLELFGVEFLKTNLKTSLLSKIRHPELRKRYELAKKILRGETLSFSGWDSDFRRIKMYTETELKIKGIQILTSTLGAIEAERFISLIIKEPFDYTKWQRDLWKHTSVKELSKKAMNSLKEKT